MLINDLNYLESAEAEVVGGGRGTRTITNVLNNTVRFNSVNRFQTIVVSPGPVKGISAAAGAKADTFTYSGYYNAFTKADTESVVDEYGNSTSLSTSAAVLSW